MGREAPLRLYRRLDLRTKFALSTALSIVLLFSVLLPTIVGVSRRAILSEAKRKGFQLTKVFAHSSVQAVVTDDYLVMRQIVNSISTEPGVLYALILGPDGRVLVHSNVNETGKVYTDALSRRALAADEPYFQETREADGQPVYDFTVPVYVLNQKRVTARVGISLEAELAAVARTRNRILGTGILALGAGLLWAILQARRITRPVAELVRGAQQIAAGNLDCKIPVASGDELGQLGEAFNRMGDSLKARFEIDREISSTLDLQGVLQTIARQTQALLKTDLAHVAPCDPRTGVATVVAAVGDRTGALIGQKILPGKGAGGIVLQTGEPLGIADYVNDPRISPDYRRQVEREGIVSALVVPIALKGKTIGLLYVANRRVTVFTPQDQETLSRLASQAAIAIENARLFTDLNATNVRLEASQAQLRELYRLSTLLQEPYGLPQQLDLVLRGIHEVLGLDRVFLFLANDAGTDLELEASFGEPTLPSPSGKPRLPLSAEGGVIALAFRERTPIRFGDETPLPPHLRLHPPYADIPALRTRVLAAIPMISRGRPIGVLAVDNKTSRRPLPQGAPDLLRIFANHAAVAIENGLAYRKIEELNVSLEEKVQLRTRELHAINRELEESHRQLKELDRLKSDFVSNVSHELRTPLTSIRMSVDNLLDGIAGPITEAQRRYFQRIRDNTNRLIHLINDLLDLGRIESGRIELHPSLLPLSEVTAEVVESLRPMALEKGIRIEAQLAPDLHAFADRDKVHQVFLNLVGNAVKFTPPGGQVTVIAGPVPGETADAGDRVQVSVEDTGEGIPDGEIEAIFDKFYQASRASRQKAQGTGLGLSIAKGLIELHGGRIWVESAPGRGSRFTFTLPARPPLPDRVVA